MLGQLMALEGLVVSPDGIMESSFQPITLELLVVEVMLVDLSEPMSME